MIGIYKITSPSGKIYIGQSIDIEKRWSFHKSSCHKGLLKNSFIKHGVNNHIFEIICECLVTELNDKERYYQDIYDACGLNGLNLKATISHDKTGYVSELTKSRMRGKKRSLEHSQKIASANRGKNHSKEHKLKISLSGKGRKHSENSKEKIRISKLGLRISDKAKIKIGKSSSLRNSGSGNPNARKIQNSETKEVFGSIKEAANSIKMNHRTLSDKLKKKSKNLTNMIYYENNK